MRSSENSSRTVDRADPPRWNVSLRRRRAWLMASSWKRISFTSEKDAIDPTLSRVTIDSTYRNTCFSGQSPEVPLSGSPRGKLLTLCNSDYFTILSGFPNFNPFRSRREYSRSPFNRIDVNWYINFQITQPSVECRCEIILRFLIYRFKKYRKFYGSASNYYFSWMKNFPSSKG